MKVIVLTDIHGLPLDDTCFLSGVSNALSIRRVGLADLLGVQLQGERLYRHLAEEGGFEAAAEKVRDLFPDAELGLGYSSGGAVLWKSVLLGLPLKRLVCISSTRLRDEDPVAISIPTLAVFGDEDPARPPASWGLGGDLDTLLLSKAGHSFYGSTDANWMMCQEKVVDFLGLSDVQV